MHEHKVGPGALEAIDRAFTGVRSAVVDDPEHALRRRVRLAGHDLRHEPCERFDAGLRLAAPEQSALGVIDIQRGELGFRP